MMRVGLVFAGGFAKGAYQIGAMRALEEFIPKSDICCISAASIGALNAYAYATDNLARVEKLWRELIGQGERRVITKVLRGEVLQQLVDSVSIGATSLSRPLYCPLLDWRKQTLVYRDLSTTKPDAIQKYLRAAVTLPPYNPPLPVENATYYDGGLVDNIPVAPLMNAELDYVICFYFDETNYLFENAYFDNRIIKVSFTSSSMLSHSFVMTKDKIDEMIQVGYDVTMEKFRSVFANGTSDLDHIYKTIEEANQTVGTPTSRLTVDVVISNLNRVTQKLTKRKYVQ